MSWRTFLSGARASLSTSSSSCGLLTERVPSATTPPRATTTTSTRWLKQMPHSPPHSLPHASAPRCRCCVAVSYAPVCWHTCLVCSLRPSLLSILSLTHAVCLRLTNGDFTSLWYHTCMFIILYIIDMYSTTGVATLWIYIMHPTTSWNIGSNICCATKDFFHSALCHPYFRMSLINLLIIDYRFTRIH